MKVEINQNLIERITSFVENDSADDAVDIIEKIHIAIKNSKKEYENHIEDLTDNIQV